MIPVTFAKFSAMTTSKIVSATYSLFSLSVCYLHINRITAGLLKASSWFFSPFGCFWFYWGKQFHNWLRSLWLGTILNTISCHLYISITFSVFSILFSHCTSVWPFLAHKFSLQLCLICFWSFHLILNFSYCLLQLWNFHFVPSHHIISWIHPNIL